MFHEVWQAEEVAGTVAFSRPTMLFTTARILERPSQIDLVGM